MIINKVWYLSGTLSRQMHFHTACDVSMESAWRFMFDDRDFERPCHSWWAGLELKYAKYCNTAHHWIQFFQHLQKLQFLEWNPISDITILGKVSLHSHDMYRNLEILQLVTRFEGKNFQSCRSSDTLMRGDFRLSSIYRLWIQLRFCNL